jgi:hypothetical protein
MPKSIENEDIFMLAVRFPRSTVKRPDRVLPDPDITIEDSLEDRRFLFTLSGTVSGAISIGPFLP